MFSKQCRQLIYEVDGAESKVPRAHSTPNRLHICSTSRDESQKIVNWTFRRKLLGKFNCDEHGRSFSEDSSRNLLNKVFFISAEHSTIDPTLWRIEEWAWKSHPKKNVDGNRVAATTPEPRQNPWCLSLPARFFGNSKIFKLIFTSFYFRFTCQVEITRRRKSYGVSRPWAEKKEKKRRWGSFGSLDWGSEEVFSGNLVPPEW